MTRNIGALVVLMAVFLALAGCAASLPDAGRETAVPVTPWTTVVITPNGSHLPPFVRGESHLAASARRLERVLGHGVQIQIDAALVPADRERFAMALVDAIDNAALALEGDRYRSPSAFAHGAPLLRVIASRYDTVSDYVRSDLDEATGVLRVRLPAPLPDGAGVPRSALFEPVVVHHAIEGAYSAWLFARFTGIDQSQIAAADQGLYADFVARMATATPAGMGLLMPGALTPKVPARRGTAMSSAPR
jgi:hypothetical protein